MVFSIHFCSYVIPGLTLDSDSLMYWIPAVAGMTEVVWIPTSTFVRTCFRGNDKEEYRNDIYG